MKHYSCANVALSGAGWVRARFDLYARTDVPDAILLGCNELVALLDNVDYLTTRLTVTVTVTESSQRLSHGSQRTLYQ